MPLAHAETIVDPRRLLVVQSDPDLVRAVERLLAATDRGRAYEVCWAASIRELRTLDSASHDLAICACDLPDGGGLEVLALLQEHAPGLGVVLTGGPGDVRLAVEAIRRGAIDFVAADVDLATLPLVVEKCLAHCHVKEENARLHGDLSRSLEELESKNRQLETVIHQLERMARTDELTGLANRRWLNLMLEGTWAEANRVGLPLAFMMMDLDGFKALNDTMGHQRGDELLRRVGRVIAANCRDVDCCARYGGDEFSVLLPHASPEAAVEVARRVMREFELMAATLPAGEPSVGISIGVAHADLSCPVNADQLVMHADEALYAAKELGGRRVVLREARRIRAA